MNIKNGTARANRLNDMGMRRKRGFMNNARRVALYARVSTNNVHQDSEGQLLELREHAAHRGWQVADEFVDRISGSKDSRPQLDRLMTAARERRVDIILVWKLDRWGRSLKHLVESLAELSDLGVSFVSLKDGFDMMTAAGRAMFGMCAVMAEFERDLIRERVRMGLRNAKAKGKRLGRPRAALPMDKAQALRAQGATLREIAKKLRLSPALVCRELKAAASN